MVGISAAPAEVVAAEGAPAADDGRCRQGSASACSCSAGGDSDSSVDAVDPFNLRHGSPPAPPLPPAPPTVARPPDGPDLGALLGRLMLSERSGDAAELASIARCLATFRRRAARLYPDRARAVRTPSLLSSSPASSESSCDPWTDTYMEKEMEEKVLGVVWKRGALLLFVLLLWPWWVSVSLVLELLLLSLSSLFLSLPSLSL